MACSYVSRGLRLAPGGLTDDIVHRLGPLDGTPHSASEVRSTVATWRLVEPELAGERFGVLDQRFACVALQPTCVLGNPSLGRDVVPEQLRLSFRRALIAGGELILDALLLGLVTVLIRLGLVAVVIPLKSQSLGFGTQPADLGINPLVRLLVVLLATATGGVVVVVGLLARLL
jgi:hypothetical protein